ncbi:MAG TPA: ABC transporter ATP-binding protein [Acetobacteraceae bacterium]|jgi:ATP-binding cassette, subfamily B, bacterial|nr:ABC transporter ATP-binding protein [Acetobacteraceae bacterium]
MAEIAAKLGQEMADLSRLRASPLGFLWHYVRRHAWGHAIVFLSVLVAVVCAVATQYGLKHLIDIVSAGPAHDGGIWWAFALLCVLVAADNLLWRVGGWAAAYTFVAVTGDIRRDLFAHLSGHSPSYFAERLPGALASRITATANAAFITANTGSWNVLPPCVGVVCAIIFIGFVNPTMAGALVGVAAGLGALIFHLARRGTPLHRSFASKAAAVDGELVDVIGNMGVVRAFGATFREQKRIGATIGVEMGARRASLLYLERLRLIHAVITAVLIAGVVAWGILLWQQGQATVGDLVLITALSFGILHSTRDLAVALVDLTQHLARLEEAIASLLTEHELPDRPGATALLPGAGQVVFDHVRFAYPGRAAVLREFDLSIEPGQRVGLVGYSGAGKSTVLALLQRFYDVERGRVLIDGQDIRDVTQDSLRATMAIVPQDISLFHRTVLENIRYARPEAPEADVLAAAEMANCREFIEALPDGFATMVGDRGVKLSGGQRQRLAIARALLKDAPILLLDEATSALDSESERAIQDALDRLMHGRTVIAIAHRLSTLKRFDRIIVMDHGRIIDDGSPDVLAARPGPYRELLRKQQLLEPIPEAA